MSGAFPRNLPRALATFIITALSSLGLGACGEPPVLPAAAGGMSALADASAALPPPAPDLELAACRARVEAVMQLPELPGAPLFDARRAEFLGRARGEPMVFLREPAPTPDDQLRPAWLASRRLLDRGRPGARIAALHKRHRFEPEALRALVLREGYAYAPDPLDALAIVNDLGLPDLFSEPEIWLQRGGETRRLRREVKRREVVYRYVDGPLQGRAADLLFGDRLGGEEADLASPIHRDLRALADVEGFDRTRIRRRTSAAILADLRFGGRFVPAVLEADDAALRLGCIAEGHATREAIREIQRAEAPRRRALRRMHEVITAQLLEALPFDRPEGETTADHDGELRPFWATAYRMGRSSFDYQGTSYLVFDGTGKPWPPQVCVDFVLDTFERTSGTWFNPRGSTLGRVRGRLDFDDVGIPNRRGVLAFGKFAETKPEYFAFRRFHDEERIKFRDRARFFGFLTDHADEVRAGDVVAIHGLKADERIHQHAILVEWSDPVTGFPYGLADQMKRPRRRTWEGIMAEAPLRSLLYRARPEPTVFDKLDPGEGKEGLAAASP
jgi:hypothetical protein